MDSLEGLFLRPRQVRYQAALRPDICERLVKSTVHRIINDEARYNS